MDIAGDVISKGVIQAKTLRSAKRHASIDSGADKWGKKWLFEPAAGHVKYDGDARSSSGSHRQDDFKPVEKMLVLREVDDIFAHPTMGESMRDCKFSEGDTVDFNMKDDDRYDRRLIVQ